MTKTAWIEQELASLKAQGLFTTIRTIDSPMGAWIEVDGKRVLNFCANNYLGLADHPRLKQAAKEAIDRYGVGPGAVRTIAGTLGMHLQLEQRLAAFKGVEAAITFQSGFNANLATIPALVGKGDVIFSDRLNHASIIDGCRLSRAKIVAYEHADPDDLRRQIAAETEYGRRLIVTDGVFSMDGDIAPLPALQAIAAEHDILLMVDDAHGEGVLGRGGRGIVDHFGLHGQVDVEVGTMSKAFGVVGGVVAGKPGHRGLAAPARAALPVLQRHDRAGHRRLPGRGGPAGRIDRAGGAPVAKRRGLQGRDEDAGLRHRPHPDPDHAGHAGRGSAGAGVQPASCSRRACSPWPSAIPPCRRARPASA